eukprot:TRINITY_DN108054_c0_g1_i1.p1 TRINITY_DN108054_c0_g1~~TRINITY_DN108054_c0_g1_i1.p1  ORF type:complete len:268 (+),score=75.98 TRINITY_DN108054_c0_g1_i1:104-907(+)
MAAPALPDPTTCTCDTNASGDRKVSREELEKHRSEASCWVLLRGAIWDLTPFLADHPGGPGAILEFAGRDATSIWESVHPPEVLAQLSPSLRIGEADNELAAAAQAPETVSEQLLHACKMGGSTEVDELLRARADPNHQGGQGGEAPLHWAARKGLPPMAASLLAASAELEARDLDGQTPLLLAARNSQQKILSELLSVKASVNASDSRGETALHAAAALGSVRLVKLLLGAGADPSIQDKEGNTPADTAAEHGHSPAEDLITAALE